MSLIYKITNPEKEVYIGSTSRSLSLRKAEHKYSSKNNKKSKLCNSFYDFGFENHSFEVVSFVKESNRIELEHFIIQEYNTKLNEVEKYNNTAQGKIWVNNDIIEFQIYKDDLNKYQGIKMGRLLNRNLGRPKT
jgi:group I intron endonuclease